MDGFKGHKVAFKLQFQFAFPLTNYQDTLLLVHILMMEMLINNWQNHILSQYPFLVAYQECKPIWKVGNHLMTNFLLNGNSKAHCIVNWVLLLRA